MRAGADGHFKQAWLATVSLLLFTTSPLKSCKVKCHVVYSTISPCSPLDGLLKLLTQKLWYSQRLLTSERCSSWSCVVIRSRRFGPSFINHSGSPSVGFFYTSPSDPFTQSWLWWWRVNDIITNIYFTGVFFSSSQYQY